MRILGLDVGERRIGIAISDGLCLTAQGLRTLDRESIEKDLEVLKGVIKAHQVGEVVVGLPLNMDGSLGAKAKEAVKFVEALKEELDLSVKLWDERLTTLEATSVLVSANLSRKKRRRVVDKLAAQLILQGYLDARRKKEDV